MDSIVEEQLHDLRGTAARLRTKIKSCYHRDYFFDAEKYECELELVEAEIKELNNGKL